VLIQYSHEYCSFIKFCMKKFLIVLLFIFSAQAAQAAEEFTVRIQPGPEEGKDTYYGVGSVGGRDGRPDADHLRIGGWGDEWFTFIEFNIDNIPEEAEVLSAKFGLFNYRGDSNPNSAKVNRVVEYWNESDPSDISNPAYVDIGMEWKPVLDSSWWIVDVTSSVQGWKQNLYQNYGFGVRGQLTSNNRVKGFYSSDYLGDPSLRPYLEITYTLHEEEEDVDPLVLQYAPKLALHPDEDYLPMDVIDFVEASALWDMDGRDRQLYDAATLTPEQFETVVGSDDTSEYYLAFSDPDQKKSIDLAAAKTKYDALDSPTTVYYQKMDDGDYTVLQYWYFYAMNNWKEYDGLNNHEGDWESVFVYLDKESLEPRYIAYSAHRNDGDPAWNVLQYDSVRRSWESDEIDRQGDTVTSYVALGSHANYPNNDDGVHDAGVKDDLTSAIGPSLDSAEFLAGNEIAESTPFWMAYEGLWGTDTIGEIGGDAPQGPAFSDIGGTVRFLNPVAWAGIDAIRSHFTTGGETSIDFQGTGVVMAFEDALPPGERFEVAPHDEYISFGEKPRGVTLLPKFWDITSSLANETFSAEVTFNYDPDVVAQLGGNQQTLSVFYYDQVQKKWEQQRSVVNTEDETVSFPTNHFSRYALGFVAEEVYTENLFGELKAVIEETSLQKFIKKALIRKVQLAERLAQKDRRGTKVAAKRLLTYVGNTADRLVRFGQLTEEEAAEIDSLVQRILVMIR